MKSLTPIAIFVGGVIVGFIICYMLHSTNESLTEVSESEARDFYHNYSQNPTQGTIRAVYIDEEQLHALNELSSSRTSSTTNTTSTSSPTDNSNQNGYRIYLGKDAQNGDCSLVVCVNSGRDICTKIIKTNAVFNACPTLCDATSSIMR